MRWHNIWQLRYDVWRGIPLLIGNDYSIMDIPGFITVPYNFEVNEFIAYVILMAPKVRRVRTELASKQLAFAVRAQHTAEKISCRQILNTAGADAMEMLVVLESISKQLRALRLENITINICDKFDIDTDGGIIHIPHSTAAKQVMELLSQHKLELTKAKQAAESTMLAIHCKNKLKRQLPGLHDVIFSVSLTAKQKLQLLTELLHNAHLLQKFEWDDMTLVFDQDFFVDTKHRYIYVPASCDVADILNFLEDVHR